MRYVTITTYSKMVGISRPAVYKRIKSGKAVLMADCEVSLIDTEASIGKMTRNNFKKPNEAPKAFFSNYQYHKDNYTSAFNNNYAPKTL